MVVLSPSCLLASESSNGKLCDGLEDALKGCRGGRGQRGWRSGRAMEGGDSSTMAEGDTYTDFLISVIFIDLCFQLLLGGIG